MYSKIINPQTGQKVYGDGTGHCNISSVPWNYTGQNPPNLNTLTRVLDQPYYFKMRTRHFTGTIAGSTYWGPLYLYQDGSYRSCNSIEAGMMFQKALLNSRPLAFRSGKNLNVLRTGTVNGMVILMPRHGGSYPAGFASSITPLPGSIQYLLSCRHWTRVLAPFGEFVDLVEPLSEETWVVEQTARPHNSLYNLAVIKKRKKRCLRQGHVKRTATHLKKRRNERFGFARAITKLPHVNINVKTDTVGNRETIKPHALGVGTGSDTNMRNRILHF